MPTIIPQTGTRVAPGAPFRPGFRPAGPSLNERLVAALKTARADERVMGEALPQVVKDASKTGRVLLTSTAARAIDFLASSPRIPIGRLYALGLEIIGYVRQRRGIPAPDLMTAMRHEEAANAALNIAQWAEEGPLSLGRLHTLRRNAAVQVLASMQLLQSIDTEIARQEGASRAA